MTSSDLKQRHTKPNRRTGRFVLIFFLDGVGLGSDNPEVNPFVRADMPNIANLLGAEDWFVARNGRLRSSRATLVPTDATLSVSGRPQSATGQATILSGRNVPLLVGEHYGPKPNDAVANVINQGTMFTEIADRGGSAALITPYPQGYFDAIRDGVRIYSAIPLAVTSAGWPLFTADDLRNGCAVSPDFTNEGWRDHLGFSDIEIITPYGAGERIASISADYDLSFFEHWPSDYRGHRGSLTEAVRHLEQIDEVVGGLLARWPEEEGVLIITSDHGNIEEKDHRKHTRNQVPTIIISKDHWQLAQQIVDLTDIARVVRTVFNLEKEKKRDEYRI
jgi:2,3-bisphosphoglycerate-independent phosphoglycerate mutase